MGSLYTAISSTIFDQPPPEDPTTKRGSWGTAEHVTPILASLGLDPDFAHALDDPSFDAVIEAETEEALSRAGRDVGTPILAFQPPDGPAFFGPVISRLPSSADAVRIWDAVITLAGLDGFAEMKRSLRERPQLRSFGVEPGSAGTVEDWHGGSRRLNSEKG